MRTIAAYIALLVAGMAASVPQQSMLQSITNSRGVTVTGGWQFLQGTSGSVNANGGAGFQIQAKCGSSTTNTCTFDTLPTTAGSVRAIGIVDINNENIKISSAFDCSAAPPCNGGNALDTAVLCAASACQIQNSNDVIDVSYVTNGAAGATHVTVTLSGTPASNQEYFEYMEMAPPKCNGTPCSTGFDANKTMHFASGTCATLCTDGAGMTLSATDGIIGIIDTNAIVGSFNVPYFIDSVGNVLGTDATSAAALQVKTAGFFTLSNIAFKSSAGSYVPNSAIFSNVFPAPGDGLPMRQNTCSPGCTVTWPGTTGTGHLLFIFSGPNTANATISSITGGGTWVLPTGASTCKNTTVSTNPLACGYVLSSSSGATSLSVTMSTNCTCNFYMVEISRSSGSFVLDTQNSSSNAGSSNPVTGQALTLGGTVDVCFSEIEWTATSIFEASPSFYPQPGGANEFGVPGTPSGGGIGNVALNVRTFNTPSVLLESSSTNSTVSGICFK